MKGLNIDFKKVALGTLGEGAGLAAAHKVNGISFIQKQKPMIRGLALIGIGKILLPILAAKMAGKGKSAQSHLIEGLGAGISTYGAGVILSNMDATKSFVPPIAGYEDNIYLGAVYDQYQDGNNGMSGADDEEMSGADDDVFIQS